MAPHTSDAPCRSLVEDSVSLTTTALVTCMSGCCCLASCIAIARACKERTVVRNESQEKMLNFSVDFVFLHYIDCWVMTELQSNTAQLQFRLDFSTFKAFFMLAIRAETICPFKQF